MLGMDIHLACCFGEKVYYISEIDNNQIGQELSEFKPVELVGCEDEEAGSPDALASRVVHEAIVKEFYVSQYSVSYGVYDEKKKYFFVLEPDEVYFTREEAEEAI